MDNEIYDFLEELIDWQGEDITPEGYDRHVRPTARRLLANRVIETDNQLAKRGHIQLDQAESAAFVAAESNGDTETMRLIIDSAKLRQEIDALKAELAEINYSKATKGQEEPCF
jgi:hypothetical protein